MLVTDMYLAVQDIIGDPQALRTGLMLRVANRKLQELCRRFKCKFMLRSGTVTTVDGTAEYNLPSDWYKPQIVYETTNDNWLRHITYRELRQKYPDASAITEGVPTHYAPRKIVWVYAQNTTASKVACVTTETITIRIKGMVSGLVKSEDVSCTTGSTNSANTYDIGGLISITAATAPTAAISCTTDVGVTTVLSLAIGQKTKQRTRTLLYPTPDTAYTTYMDYYAMHEDLTSTNDNIMLPKPYEEWLIYTTSAEILKMDGRKEANEYLQLGQIVFDQMVADEMIEPDEKWTSWLFDYPEEYEF